MEKFIYNWINWRNFSDLSILFYPFHVLLLQVTEYQTRYEKASLMLTYITGQRVHWWWGMWLHWQVRQTTTFTTPPPPKTNWTKFITNYCYMYTQSAVWCIFITRKETIKAKKKKLTDCLINSWNTLATCPCTLLHWYLFFWEGVHVDTKQR